ncbi:hypothetical protein Tco_0147992 [Tanacetum coccineum]
MPPRRAPSSKRATVTNTASIALMSIVAINQLIETRVAKALANQELLRNGGVNGDGVIGLTQWMEKMESVFHISGCTVDAVVGNRLGRT